MHDELCCKSIPKTSSLPVFACPRSQNSMGCIFYAKPRVPLLCSHCVFVPLTCGNKEKEKAQYKVQESVQPLVFPYHGSTTNITVQSTDYHSLVNAKKAILGPAARPIHILLLCFVQITRCEDHLQGWLRCRCASNQSRELEAV